MLCFTPPPPQVCKVEEKEAGTCGGLGKPQCGPRGAFSLPYDVLILGVSHLL